MTTKKCDELSEINRRLEATQDEYQMLIHRIENDVTGRYEHVMVMQRIEKLADEIFILKCRKTMLRVKCPVCKYKNKSPYNFCIKCGDQLKRIPAIIDYKTEA